MSLLESYYQTVTKILAGVMESQAGAIQEAGRLGAEALLNGGLIHAFGTGHSHMLAEELFSRAGGLPLVNAIIEPSLTLVEGSQRSSSFERLPGLAERLLALEPLSPGDLMIIASNSGRNAVPVEAAIYARERGLKVVAITSLAHSRSQPATHASGRRLFELADVVIDNLGIPGDAALEVPGSPTRACATSTVVGSFIVQGIVAEVVERLVEAKLDPLPLMRSGNLDDARVHNARVLATYRDRLARIRTYDDPTLRAPHG
ncbi:MAG: SIS domain-containing protein [Bacillota bacterium]